MAGLKMKGLVVGKNLEVRFSLSGKLKSVHKHLGDVVLPGDILASLDNTALQTQLDLELAAYEKTRAQFEIFHQKQTGEGDLFKYLSIIEQSDLDTSVKRVELAKLHLDEAVLRSPVEGTITDDGGCFPGIYITPSSHYYTLCLVSEKIFQFEINQAELAGFSRPRTVTVRFENWEKSYSGTTAGPVQNRITKSDPPKFIVSVNLLDCDGLLPGMEGEGELD